MSTDETAAAISADLDEISTRLDALIAERPDMREVVGELRKIHNDLSEEWTPENNKPLSRLARLLRRIDRESQPTENTQ